MRYKKDLKTTESQLMTDRLNAGEPTVQVCLSIFVTLMKTSLKYVITKARTPTIPACSVRSIIRGGASRLILMWDINRCVLLWSEKSPIRYLGVILEFWNSCIQSGRRT